MALVRCTCIAGLSAREDRPEVTVTLADPMCGYLPHRAMQDGPDLEPIR